MSKQYLSISERLALRGCIKGNPFRACAGPNQYKGREKSLDSLERKGLIDGDRKPTSEGFAMMEGA